MEIGYVMLICKNVSRFPDYASNVVTDLAYKLCFYPAYWMLDLIW